MKSGLDKWEDIFGEKLHAIPSADRLKAGALLQVIPNREDWEDFTASAKTVWHTWHHDLIKYPKCLVMLYGGLAFYEYDENTFWPQFYKTVESVKLPANQQTEINNAFSKASEHLGLKVQQRNKGTDYIGSAVYHIGIPLSLWDGFLEICEWALWREDWSTLTDEEWAESIGKRTGGRKRLKNFLIGNRDAAATFIKEVIDARQILINNLNYTIADLKQACLLRSEYFDEVPETAEFLRPQNPESLFQDRARLICDLQRRCISVQLPAVKKDKLPATWSIGTCIQEAATTPDELILNSQAFDTTLNLKLKSEAKEETQRLFGIRPWGIIDLEKGEFVNPKRQQLPLRSYTVISPEKLEVSRKGFDEEENPVNEPFEFSDGRTCFVTRVVPTGKYAELIVRHSDIISKKTFRTRSKIEARFFVGRGNRAANFTFIDNDKIKTDTLPILCLVIPYGYFNDIKTALNKFQVLMDGKPAGGLWERQNMQGDEEEREFYFWKWSKKPFIELKKHATIKDLKQLGDCFGSSDLKGDHTLSIKSPEFKIDYKIYIDHSKDEIKKCWENLPGAFLPWFLLCQPNQGTQGMKWDDLILANDIIALKEHISYYLLRKYEDKGLIVLKGHRWMIAESRAVVKEANNKCLLQYCGNPSILWGLYRRMYHENIYTLPLIEVIVKRRELPYLQMSWERYLRGNIEKYLLKNGVHFGDSLWSH